MQDWRACFSNGIKETFTIRLINSGIEPQARSHKQKWTEGEVSLSSVKWTVKRCVSARWCLPAGRSASLLWILLTTVSAVRAARPLMFKPSSLPPSSHTWDQRGDTPNKWITPSSHFLTAITKHTLNGLGTLQVEPELLSGQCTTEL